MFENPELPPLDGAARAIHSPPSEDVNANSEHAPDEDAISEIEVLPNHSARADALDQNTRQIEDFFLQLEKLLSSFSFSEFPASAGADTARLRETLTQALLPVWNQCKETIGIVRDKNAFFDQKAAAAEKLIGIVEALCMEHHAQILPHLASIVKTADPLSVETGEKNGAASPAVREAFSVEKVIPVFFGIVRQLWKIEERNLYTIATSDVNSSHRIQAIADVAKDVTLFQRQFRALLGLREVLVENISRTFGEVDAISDSREGDKSAKALKSIESLFVTVAPKLVPHLENLGPFWQKATQTISVLVSALDPVAFEKFAHFQSALVKHMPFPETCEIIERDLGRPISAIFAEFEEVPFAVASIAQVHRAKLINRDGSLSDVVVKVKKSWVEEELACNIRVNQAFISYATLSDTGGEFHTLLQFFASQMTALAETFQSELDFKAEARRQIRFSRLYMFDPDIEVPRIHRRACGESVICMDDIGPSVPFNVKIEPYNGQLNQPRNGGRGDLEENNLDDSSSRVAGEAVDQDSSGEFEGLDGKKNEESIEPEENRHEEVPDAPPEFLSTLQALYMDINEKCGFRFGAQYLQVGRGLLPALGMLLSVARQTKLNRRDPETLTEEEKKVGRRLSKLIQLIVGQVFYIKELHTDLQPGNIPIDANEKMHLLDFGQTRSTRGLVSLPVWAVLSVMMGNARGLARTILKMGTVSPDSNEDALVSVIQDTFAQIGIVRKTYFQLLKELVSTDSKRTAAEKFDIDSSAADHEPQITVGESENAARGGNVDDQKQDAPSEAKDRKGVSADSQNNKKLLGILFKAVVKYPVRRAYYAALSAYDSIAHRIGF